ncbi:hypothetical protein OOT00_05735 [Desulfobotulus sp. H1]|uniref:Uncharacterized protein n=1 Tax=Desulfobotulus pelophilus TaxID=2823377 RepID=A0ABT3N7Q8_9BACT|nr:hypothetical protein [Desulfobotulus pelophilus]MCW7753487.1 hypothetical protein [Desulfobotulus pelophilus]
MKSLNKLQHADPATAHQNAVAALFYHILARRSWAGVQSVMCFEGMVTKVKISISSEEFVNEFSELKRQLIEGYFSEDSDISRLTILKEAGIEAQQLDVVKGIVDDSLTDAFYTILLGLDGCASIGKHQIEYKLPVGVKIDVT